MGSTSSIRIRSQTNKLKIKFCMWFQAQLLSFYSNLCPTYEISQISFELKHKKIPSSISAMSACGLVLYSSSRFQRCAQLFLEPNIRREATSWLGWPYGSPVMASKENLLAFKIPSLLERTSISPIIFGQLKRQTSSTLSASRVAW
jgi:hypothetical protein